MKPEQEALICAQASNAIYGTASDPNGRDSSKAAMEALGFSQFVWFDLTTVFKDICAFIVSSDECHILVFRGTKLPQDWMEDLKCTPVRFDWVFNGGPSLGEIHAGFGHCLADELKNITSDLSSRDLHKPLIITGHSLGGALAALAGVCFNVFGSSMPTVSAIYTFGQPRIGLHDFCNTYSRILADKLVRFRRVDLCPQIGADQSGQLRIIPYKEIPKYVQAGDVVSFVTTNDTSNWRNGDLITMIKQRGWHAEIVTPNQGDLVLRGPWNPNGEVACTPVENVTLHPRYSGLAGIWNLHFFRFSPPNNVDQARFCLLMKGLEAWSAIFPCTTWPSDMAFNPILYADISSLAKIGDALIQKITPPPKMFCIEWVNAVFSLACCYPLTKKFLSGRGMLSTFNANFPNVILLDDSLESFDALPWAPYDPKFIIESFLNTYFAENLSDAVIAALPGEASIPSPVIMPIVPLLESRRKSNPSNFDVTYICTAVADGYCIPR